MVDALSLIHPTDAFGKILKIGLWTGFILGNFGSLGQTSNGEFSRVCLSGLSSIIPNLAAHVIAHFGPSGLMRVFATNDGHALGVHGIWTEGWISETHPPNPVLRMVDAHTYPPYR